VPQIATVEPRGLRLAWQDERTGVFNTSYARRTRRYGADPALEQHLRRALQELWTATFTHGDYPEQAVNLLGTAFVIWGEADGSSI
jgi:hypothetical protein